MTDMLNSVELVNSKFNDSRAYSQSAFATANSLLGALAGVTYSANIASVDTNITLPVFEPEIVAFGGTSWTFPTVCAPPVGANFLASEKITVNNLPFNSKYPTEPIKPNLLHMPGLNLGTPPSFVAALHLPNVDINNIIQAAESILVSLQHGLDIVGPTLLGFITNPTQAIGSEVVTAMTNAALQKIEDEFQTKYTEVTTYYSSRGWNTPQGVIVARVSELDRLRVLTRSYVQRDVLIKNFELSQQNFIAAMQLYISYTHENNVLIMSTLQQLYEAVKYANDYAIAEFNAYIAKFTVESDVYKLKVSSHIQEILAVVSINQGYISQYGAEINAYSAKIGAISSYNANLIQQQDSKIKAAMAELQSVAAHNTVIAQQYTADAQVYSSTIQATVANAESNMKSAQLEIQGYEILSKTALETAEIFSKNAQVAVSAKQASVQMAIAQLDMTLRNMSTMSTITAEVAKASATIAAQLAASSLSAVSAGATIGFQENANYNMTKDIVETSINLTGSV